MKCRKLHFHIGSNLISGEVYENFFVCNYGVGGNVLGQPVFDCPDDRGSTSATSATANSTELPQRRPPAPPRPSPPSPRPAPPKTTATAATGQDVDMVTTLVIRYK